MRTHGRDGTIVVEQRARWRSFQDGEPGEALPAASVFRVRDGRVANVIRYDSVRDALSAAGLT